MKIFDQLCCQILNVHMGERQNFVNPQNPDLDMQFTSDKNFVCSEPVPKTCCSWNMANYFRTLLPIGPPSHSSSYRFFVTNRTWFLSALDLFFFPQKLVFSPCQFLISKLIFQTAQNLRKTKIIPAKHPNS